MGDFKAALWVPSPNYWPSRYGYEPQFIVLHGTDGQMPGCLDWLTSPQSGASVHYLVAQTGSVYQLVSEDCAAWGNGIPEPPSSFCGKDNPNFYTISIETERWDENQTPLTANQIAALTSLVADIRARHGDLPCIPHSAISPQSRAHCPGPSFPVDALDKTTPIAPRSGPTQVKFDATPQRLPLIFYKKGDFSFPLYQSQANKQTTIHFDAWCYGTPVNDPSTKAADRRWYHRFNPAGQAGWTPSAWVLGNAPDSQP